MALPTDSVPYHVLDHLRPSRHPHEGIAIDVGKLATGVGPIGVAAEGLFDPGSSVVAVTTVPLPNLRLVASRAWVTISLISAMGSAI